MFTASERGYGKKTEIGQYPRHRRGGQGVLNLKVGGKIGNALSIVGIAEEELLIITVEGKVIRIKTTQFRSLSRATQGVRHHQPRVTRTWSAPSPRSGRAEALLRPGAALCPRPPGTSPVGPPPRRTSVGDADDFRAPLRLSEGVGGGKKYEQSLGRVAEIAFIGLGSPLRYGGQGRLQAAQ